MNKRPPTTTLCEDVSVTVIGQYLAGGIAMASGQREFWEEERRGPQQGQRRNRHAEGELNATSHMATHRWIQMG